MGTDQVIPGLASQGGTVLVLKYKEQPSNSFKNKVALFDLQKTLFILAVIWK